MSPVRPFYWSVRRELWEHRSVWVGPLAAGGLVLLGFLIGLPRLPAALARAEASPRAAEALMFPYAFAALAVLLVALIVAVFYSLGALQGERRDRSILFWKSLPVSDLVTVLSKAAVPLAVLPLVVLGVVLSVQLAMLLLTGVVAAGGAPAPWAHLGLGLMWAGLAHGLAVLSLWYAPICAWLILVSAWARRASFLWAVGPFLGLFILERLAFGTQHAFVFVRERLEGGFAQAFTVRGEGRVPFDRFSDIDPVRTFANPELWAGVAVAALLLVAAARLRRSREPT